MNIVIASDDHYIVGTKVMLTSFLVNNRKEHHKIYFMYGSVKPENLDGLMCLVGKYDAELIPVSVSKADFAEFKFSGHFTVETYYRLNLPHVLPKTEERALWLDVDIVVNGALDEFYYQDFEGYSLVGCREATDQRKRFADIGCAPDGDYINAGVILYNLPAVRHYQLSDYYEHYCKYQKYMYLNDQDIINSIFTKKIKVLNREPHNVMISSIGKEWCNNLENVTIIHYVGPYKPWKKTYFHSAGKVWDHYNTIVLEKGAISAKIYMTKNCIRRFIQRSIFPLRVLHGKLHEAWAEMKQHSD